MFLVLHFRSNKQSCFFLQFHERAFWMLELIRFLYCDLMIFTIFLCNSSLPWHCSYWIFYETSSNVEKCWSNSWMNFFATFAMTGGLNNLIIRCRGWNDKLILLFQQLYFKASSYSSLDISNTLSFEELLHNLSLIISGNWLVIWGGWLELLIRYNSR